MKFLLYFDNDQGQREAWNTFYTPCEIFDSIEEAKKREKYIKELNPEIETYITNPTLKMSDEHIKEM